VRDEHAELGSPIADVVLSNNAVPDEFHNPAERVANDRASEVPNVHLLGNIWGGVIDDDRLWIGSSSDSEACIAAGCRNHRAQPFRTKSHIDKPRPCDRDFASHLTQV